MKCAFQTAICILQPISSLASADTSQGWGRQQPTSVGSAQPQESRQGRVGNQTPGVTFCRVDVRVQGAPNFSLFL